MGIGSDLISEKNKCRPTFAIFFILSIFFTQGNGFVYQQSDPSTGGGGDTSMCLTMKHPDM